MRWIVSERDLAYVKTVQFYGTCVNMAINFLKKFIIFGVRFVELVHEMVEETLVIFNEGITCWFRKVVVQLSTHAIKFLLNGNGHFSRKLGGKSGDDLELRATGDGAHVETSAGCHDFNTLHCDLKITWVRCNEGGWAREFWYFWWFNGFLNGNAATTGLKSAHTLLHRLLEKRVKAMKSQ